MRSVSGTLTTAAHYGLQALSDVRANPAGSYFITLFRKRISLPRFENIDSIISNGINHLYIVLEIKSNNLKEVSK